VKVKFLNYKGIDFCKIIKEEFFSSAIRVRSRWQDNLTRGVGATGNRGKAWKDTGQAISDVTVEPQSPTEFSYEVGGDVIQLAVAEFGRSAGARIPPFQPISEWARRKGLTPRDGDTWEQMVNKIRWGIQRHGIQGFAPGRLSAMVERRKLPDRIEKRIQQEVEKITVD